MLPAQSDVNQVRIVLCLKVDVGIDNQIRSEYISKASEDQYDDHIAQADQTANGWEE